MGRLPVVGLGLTPADGLGTPGCKAATDREWNRLLAAAVLLREIGNRESGTTDS